MKSFTYISLGCKVNSYECSALADELAKNGYVQDEKNPGVVFINTCSVTSTADQKSRQHIRKLRANFPNAILIAMGCYVQGNYKWIQENIKPDIIVGTSNRNKIVGLIKEFEINKKQICLVDEKPRFFTYEELGQVNYQENVRAYLKIEDGCNNFCSYCIIPYRRGKARSRSKEQIMLEAQKLLEKGYKEIVLTGINVSFYGQDLQNESFSKLVASLLELKGLQRLRISSIEESEIDESLTNLFKKHNLAKHIHVALQSGSDTVLKRMNRKYTSQEFYEKVSLIRKLAPDVALTTDVIVGFPGETEDEFIETFNFIKKCKFAMLHVFPYSPREGTVAAKMDNQVDAKIKKERCLKIIELSNQLWDEYTNMFVNKEVEVLIEQFNQEKGYNVGHTSNYLEVHIPGDPIPIGNIEKVIYKKY